MYQVFNDFRYFLGGNNYFFYNSTLRYSRYRTFGSDFLLLLKASVLPGPFSVKPREGQGYPRVMALHATKRDLIDDKCCSVYQQLELTATLS
jgi:hypothetical protein